MASGILHPVRPTQLAPPDEDAPADADLVRRFARSRDPDAFTVLVRRHGPMVLGVCRRVLRRPHDAEEAFQATFLTLVKKAGTLARPEQLANWLYGVAYRAALKTRTTAARQSALDREAARPAHDPAAGDGPWEDLRDALDEEVTGLPEKYRAAIVLCYLEGLTNEAAARQLGWPAGSMSARLARGRELLRERLQRRTRRFLAPVPFFFWLSGQASAAPVPAGLAADAGRAAGIPRPTGGARWRPWGLPAGAAAVVLVVLLAATGFGGVTHHTRSPGDDDSSPAADTCGPCHGVGTAADEPKPVSPTPGSR